MADNGLAERDCVWILDPQRFRLSLLCNVPVVQQLTPCRRNDSQDTVVSRASSSFRIVVQNLWEAIAKNCRFLSLIKIGGPLKTNMCVSK